ncbi:probable N-acetyltransferase CML1 isoform X2 [Pseudophryne corroboree]|uniref:probable N-acetyltransferase CML1 isoform X2 n=1 Tax=Pseudophryne corroboree TaxID=495146 RepID=UPI003081A83B
MSCSIRLYKDSDYEVVREIFTCGIKEHSGTAFHHALSLPHIWVLQLLTFLVLLQTTGSLTVAVVAVIATVALLWLLCRYIYSSYVQQSLQDDMLDIRKYYLQRDGYCFWVAESAGEVVGTVAAVPPHHPGGDRQVELKRLSVPRRHRGKGIAKALCQTVIDFAKQRDCEAVILETSLSQYDACRLYEKMGFRESRNSCPPHPVTKLIDFRILFYQYDILKHR